MNEGKHIASAFDRDIETLQANFDAAAGQSRLILILAPT